MQNVEELFRRAAELRMRIEDARMACEMSLADEVAALAKAEELLRQAAIMAGQSIKTAAGTVVYSAPSMRVAWDTDALEGYVVAHPELAKLRTEKPVEARTTLRYAK